MPRLELAERSHLETISRESHAIWGAGLSLADYRSLWDEVADCAWARKYVRYRVWVDDSGELLSSAKVYRPLVRVGGRVRRGCVLGAIFTPRDRRRRGHARAMIRALLAETRERGEDVALLFSDIGTRYYEALGFRALPAEEHWGRLPRVRADASEGGIDFHPATEEDLDALREAHERSSRPRHLAIVRDREHWEYLWIRSVAFFGRLAGRRVGQRWRWASREGSPVGYLISVEGHGEWNVREVGALDGAERTMREIVEAGAAAVRAGGYERVYGWLPPELAEELAHWPIRRRRRRRAVPMIRVEDRVLAREAGAWSARECFLPFQDQF